MQKTGMTTWSRGINADFQKNRYKYLLVIPVLIFLFLFCYKPMYGAQIAFRQYRITLGIEASKWIGFSNFERLFNDIYFIRSLRNTFLLSFFNILWSFPAPIILALMLNEVRSKRFKSTVQTITYIPHFISLVIICGLIRKFSMSDGLFNQIGALFGAEKVSLLQEADLFRTIYVASDIWQNIGWDSIIYLAALSGIDMQLYEAAQLDGAGRLRQTWHITLPGIKSTIIILLILRMGSILNIGYEKVLLLYSPTTYETADVISTYVYRIGLMDGDYSYSTAVGLFNAVINLVFLMVANTIGKKSSDISLY